MLWFFYTYWSGIFTNMIKKNTSKSTFFVLYFRSMSKAKESYSKANTLSSIVGLCIGHVTTVELRNDAHVTGKIISVDGFMNVTFEKSLFCDPAGNRRKFDNFFVQNRLIRYVQIPVSIDLRSSLEKAVTNKVKKHNPEISLHRKAILRKREQRRLEDLANASKLMK